MTAAKKTFWTKTRLSIFFALLGSGTTILVAIIGKLGYNKSEPCPPTAPVSIISPVLDTGTQNIVTQPSNNGTINNEIVSGIKTVNNTVNPIIVKKAAPKEENVNNGINNGVIGGSNNSVYNVPKLPQRTVDDDWINSVIAANPDKLNYSIRYYTNPETTAVFWDIKTRLEQRGFKVTVNQVISWQKPVKIQREIEIFGTPGEDGNIWIAIYPQE